MPYYTVTLGPIPADKISELHEFCDAYNFNVEEVTFQPGAPTRVKSPTKTGVKRPKRSLQSVWVLTQKRPGRGISQQAYDALLTQYNNRPFTYAQIKDLLERRKIATGSQASDLRKNLVNGGHIKEFKK
jgi:hypothetical protein